MESSTLTDTYVTGIDRALKNITKEEPKIKVKRTQRENPFKGDREQWESLRRDDDIVDVDLGDYIFDEDGGPWDEAFIPNVENADDLRAAGNFNTAAEAEAYRINGTIPEIVDDYVTGDYIPNKYEEIWDNSKPRFKEMITIDIKGLKLVNIEGLKGRYAKGGLVTAPSNGLMSR